MKFTIPLAPIGKPRMTIGDKWKKRPAVERYWKWKSVVVAVCPKLPDNPTTVNWVGYFEIPKSWSRKKSLRMKGQPHQVRPDIDNVSKGIFDSLLKNDAVIAFSTASKYWDDGEGARIEVEII